MNFLKKLFKVRKHTEYEIPKDIIPRVLELVDEYRTNEREGGSYISRYCFWKELEELMPQLNPRTNKALNLKNVTRPTIIEYHE